MSTLNITKSEAGSTATGKSQLIKLGEIMRETIESGFYGSIEIKFEAGKVTVIRKTQSLKI